MHTAVRFKDNALGLPCLTGWGVNTTSPCKSSYHIHDLQFAEATQTPSASHTRSPPLVFLAAGAFSTGLDIALSACVRRSGERQGAENSLVAAMMA